MDIKLPFSIGDKVWFMWENKARSASIDEINLNISGKKDNPAIAGVYTFWNVEPIVNRRDLDSDDIEGKMFRTKKELLESL